MNLVKSWKLINTKNNLKLVFNHYDYRYEDPIIKTIRLSLLVVQWSLLILCVMD